MRDPSLPLSEALRRGDGSELGRSTTRPLERDSSAKTSVSESEPIADRITRVQWDLSNLESFYKIPFSPTGYDRLQKFFDDELKALEHAPFEEYDQNGKVDYLLLKNYLRHGLLQLQDDAEKDQQVLAFLGGFFPVRLARMIEARRKVADPDGKQAAAALTELMGHISMVKDRVVNKKETATPPIARRATKLLAELQALLQEWYAFYKDYDPLFTWWISDPYPKIDTALADLSDTVKKIVLGLESSDQDTIIGEPIGRVGILDALEYEMIPYTPEQLIDIGQKEYAWCETEMQKAASELGFQHWRAALEHVKNQYVPPGQQPLLVRALTQEATSYVKTHDLATVPPVCEETIQTFMMSPQDQKMNPFFLGGNSIIVSYPTSTMSHEDKLMSMRGNNKHFARATVFHEMIPGHHLHMHYMSRVRPYRQMFMTPFCIEGWAFYWEMLLWDKPSWEKTSENRIGMLFWRMHRCARIVFSLRYHLGEMSAQECVELLVNWVGHERATAEGEVRRSVMGEYGPLYQAGYMLGGLQLYALRKKVVDGLGVKEKDFHDAFLNANQMPVELFRALVSGQPLSGDFKTQWKFYEEIGR
ncbi:hypothetical protein BU26DRAFT_153246 [Trematosphaeria pertusa]|uniref:X-Pro dipeptidyl-peptidase n=1 Tax=Trematosphaeria pertusa TaxID=390896 RepID=A0A6A6IXI7_9PLEO|nr:uncharacterized protein BU26DRAFT_153246 [Trematosphaeria pertusa]KAF2255265.1 hypothetical protein BU26DRAFT_153246 [Trematosphaeria pertusa]